MRVSVVLLLLAALLCAVATQTQGSTLEQLKADIALLEHKIAQHAHNDDGSVPASESESVDPENAASILDRARAYSNSRVQAATEHTTSLFSAAAEQGKADAEALKPDDLEKLQAAAKEYEEKQKVLAAAAKKLVLEKAAKARKEAEALKAKKIAIKKAAEAKLKAAQQAAEKKALEIKIASPFKPLNAQVDVKTGTYGGVSLGVTMDQSSPVAPPTDFDTPLKSSSTPSAARSATIRIGKYDQKMDIYGNKKACLKDIAAHFDEADIYEAKKLDLQKKAALATDLKLAAQLRKKLTSLETWHAMMQRKFIASAAQRKAHERRMQKLYDEHLPPALRQQLEDNKSALRAGQPLPHPDASKQAMKVLRSLRSALQRDDRNRKRGIKRMIRPILNDKGFPSMDPISAILRQRLWHNVQTDDNWSTDAGDMETSENMVKSAHTLHGDFQHGEVAEVMNKGRLDEADTEPLGVPNFLHEFPWPKNDRPVTMDDKLPVEQTDFQAW